MFWLASSVRSQDVIYQAKHILLSQISYCLTLSLGWGQLHLINNTHNKK